MKDDERRGFFRDALSGLKKLVAEEAASDGDDAPEQLEPTFVPPPVEPPARVRRPPRTPRRPPGALAEAEFVSACTRCAACLDACPEGTLKPDAAGFPVADVAQSPCAMCLDVPCAAACEPGALQPGDVAAIARFGTAQILTRLCLNHDWTPIDDEDEPCERCVTWCPVPEVLTLGDDVMPRVDEAGCTGCGLCAAHCAAYPQAIAIR